MSAINAETLLLSLKRNRLLHLLPRSIKTAIGQPRTGMPAVSIFKLLPSANSQTTIGWFHSRNSYIHCFNFSSFSTTLNERT